MNISLLQLVGKWFSILMFFLMSNFNIGNYFEKQIIVSNINNNLDLNVVNTVTDYPVIVKYNSKLPSNVVNSVSEGVVGLSIMTEDNSKEQVIQEVVPEVVEKGTGNYGIYTGTLVGYGPDCVGCTGTGNLSCRTKAGKVHSLVNDGIYYEDDQYGKVRILAAATNKFPCGTIVEITKNGKTPFIAVVMDTGATVKNAWAKGNVIMDLAYEKNALASSDGLTGKNVKFSVQRWGW